MHWKGVETNANIISCSQMGDSCIYNRLGFKNNPDGLGRRTCMSIRLILVLSIVALFIGCGGGKVFKAENLTKSSEKYEGILYALPKGYIKLTIERKLTIECKPEFSVALAEQPILVPDPDHIYVLRHDGDSTITETLDIQIGPDGLLEKIDVSSKDSLPGVVDELTSFIVGVSKGEFPSATVSGRQEDGAPSPNTGPFKIEAVFDPNDKASLVTYLKGYGVDLTIEKKFKKINNNKQNNSNCENLICYRFLVPWKVSIVDNVTRETVDFVMLLPNEAPIAGIDVKRLALVENETTLQFNKGLLTSAKYINPSVVTSIVKIPVSMLTAIVSIPSALFQFTLKSKTDSAELTAQKNLLVLQKELAQAHLDLLEKQKELEAAQRAE